MISEDGLRRQSREVGEGIAKALPPGVGFTLILFTFGTGGWINYISNAQREDMIRALRGLLFEIETDVPGSEKGNGLPR